MSFEFPQKILRTVLLMRPVRSFIILAFWLKIESCGMDKRPGYRATQSASLYGSRLQTLLYARLTFQSRGRVPYRKSILPLRLSPSGRADTLSQRRGYLLPRIQRRDVRTRQWIGPAYSAGSPSK